MCLNFSSCVLVLLAGWLTRWSCRLGRVTTESLNSAVEWMQRILTTGKDKPPEWFLSLWQKNNKNPFIVAPCRRSHHSFQTVGFTLWHCRILRQLKADGERLHGKKVIMGKKKPKKTPVWDAKFLIISKIEFLGSVWSLSLVHRETQTPPVQLWVLSRAPVAQVWAEGAPRAARDWSNFRNWCSCVYLHCSAAMPAFQEGSLGSEGSTDGFGLSTRCQWTPCSCSPDVSGSCLEQSTALGWVGLTSLPVSAGGCFGFVLSTVMILQRYFCYCWAGLTLSWGLFCWGGAGVGNWGETPWDSWAPGAKWMFQTIWHHLST